MPAKFLPTFPPTPPQCGMDDCEHSGAQHEWKRFPQYPYHAFLMCTLGCSGHGVMIAGLKPCAVAFNQPRVNLN